MKTLFFYLSLVGFLLACKVHISSILEIDISFPWLLFIGILIIWIACIKEVKNNKNSMKDVNLNEQFSLSIISDFFFPKAPLWLKIVVLMIFVYTFFNFFYFAITSEGQTAIENGEYLLKNKSQLIKVLTEKEYLKYNAQEIRGMSGHLLLFYGLSIAILYPFNSKEKIK